MVDKNETLRIQVGDLEMGLPRPSILQLPLERLLVTKDMGVAHGQQYLELREQLRSEKDEDKCDELIDHMTEAIVLADKFRLRIERAIKLWLVNAAAEHPSAKSLMEAEAEGKITFSDIFRQVTPQLTGGEAVIKNL